MTTGGQSLPATLRKLVSSGGVLYRYWYDGTLEFLLVGRRQPPLWALPKGTPRRGETLEETALREVEEETGVRGRIVASLGSITYSFTTPPRAAGKGGNGLVRYQKTVHHFLLRPVAGDPALHDSEYDFARWLPAAAALARLSHENERTVLRRAMRLLRRTSGDPLRLKY
ncbi:MAG TPA: NUDIX domain-containing protein [Chloroflexota bacterium]|nr:NUDIX domain-containing protein [Chloroflexota bacterium]